MRGSVPGDHGILRDLAKRYADVAVADFNTDRRELWRANNDLKRPRPPVLCSWFAGSNVYGFMLDDDLVCVDPELRSHERWLRGMLFHSQIQDDHVFEPWITVRAAVQGLDRGRDGLWGFPWKVVRDAESQAWLPTRYVKQIADLGSLAATPHVVDEVETERRVGKLRDAIGDVLEINVDRSSCYGPYDGYDLSTALGYLHGIEEFMLSIYDTPELVRGLLSFMRDSVLDNFAECETAGDWSLANHWTWGHTYNSELPDPAANALGAGMGQIFKLFHAQEFALVSPKHHWEFMLQYQQPIIEKFGLIEYGCCESLEDKIDMLRKISNLRVIAVNSWAETRKCAEQIGGDYVLSLRPNPAAVCTGFDADRIREDLGRELEACGDCSVEIVLKDIMTVQGEPARLIEWGRIAGEEAERFHTARRGG